MRSSKLVELPLGGGTVLVLGSNEEIAEQERLIAARAAFVVTYCRAHGWPEEPRELSIAQILEIREQEGWKNP